MARMELLGGWVRHARRMAPGIDRTDLEAAGLELLARYEEPHRAYHDQRHLSEVLAAVALLAEHAHDLSAVVLAAWWHDAVYEIGADDNEEASARLATATLAGWESDPDRVLHVGDLVRMTAHHAPEEHDADGKVLSDADLAVLASPEHRYSGVRRRRPTRVRRRAGRRVPRRPVRTAAGAARPTGDLPDAIRARALGGLGPGERRGRAARPRRDGRSARCPRSRSSSGSQYVRAGQVRQVVGRRPAKRLLRTHGSDELGGADAAQRDVHLAAGRLGPEPGAQVTERLTASAGGRWAGCGGRQRVVDQGDPAAGAGQQDGAAACCPRAAPAGRR